MVQSSGFPCQSKDMGGKAKASSGAAVHAGAASVSLHECSPIGVSAQT